MGLAGYRAALEMYLDKHPERGSIDAWWSPHTQLVHFLGFDCAYSHAIGYAAQLLTDANGPAPGIYLTNQFLKLDGEDFSTSRGHAVWIRDITSQHPVDAVRFYTALSAPENETRNFERKHFEQWRCDIYDRIVHAYLHDLTVEHSRNEYSWPEETAVQFAEARQRWEFSAKLDAFSIAGLAGAALDVAELTMSMLAQTHKTLGWRTFAELAACIAPSMAAEINMLLTKQLSAHTHPNVRREADIVAL